jgi:hypothetical protein
MINREILTALFDDIIQGLSMFGLGMMGLSYPCLVESSADLPVASLAESFENRESK